MADTGIRGSIQAFRELPENPVAVLLVRLHRQSREHRIGWFARPLFITLAGLLFLLTLAVISRQHWALSLHDPLGTNPLYIQSSRIVAVMACLWFYFCLSMLMAFSRMLSAFNQGCLLLSGGRSTVSAIRIDDLLQGNPLEARTILDGLTSFHKLRIAPLLWYPSLYVVLGSILKFPIPLYDNGVARWHWEFLLIPLTAPLFYFISMALFRLLLHYGVLIGRRFANPLAQQLALWLLLGSPLLAMLLLVSILIPQALPDEVKGLLSGLVLALILLLPLLLSRLLHKRALAAINAAVQGQSERQAAESASTVSRAGRGSPPLMLRATCIMVLALPPLLSASVLLHTMNLKPVQVDTGDPFIDWYFGYAQQSVERQWMQHLDPKPVRLERTGSSLANGHYYIHELMQQAEEQFSADPRWQLLRYEMLCNMQDQPLAFEYGEMADNRELASLLLQQSIDNGVTSPAGEFAMLQQRWLDHLEGLNAQSAAATPEQLEQGAQIVAAARALAERHNEAAPLYWLAFNLDNLSDEETIELIVQGNALSCRFHTGSFRSVVATAVPRDSRLLSDRILCGMQPMEQQTHQAFAVIPGIGIKQLIGRLAAKQDLAGLDAIRTMLVRQLQSRDLNRISCLISYVCLSRIATEIQSQCSPGPELQQSITQLDKLAMDLRDSLKQQYMNSPHDLADTLDRQSRDYLPLDLPALLHDSIATHETRLSLGRYYACNYHYELNTIMLEIMDLQDWQADHLDEIRRLLEFEITGNEAPEKTTAGGNSASGKE